MKIQRSIIDSYVDSSTPEQRNASLGALIAIYALSNGSLQLPSYGLKTINREDISSKIAAVYIVPFLALSREDERILKKSEVILRTSLFNHNIKNKEVITSKLETLCRDTKATHREYFEQSKKIREMTFFRKKAEEKYTEFRDNKLGYRGTLPKGLYWKQFIGHTDTQYHIRDKFVETIDDVSLSAQLEYMFPKSSIKDYAMDFSSRKVINPCMTWSSYKKEYLWAMSRELGKKGGEIVINGKWDNLPAPDAIESTGKQAVYAVLVPPLGILFTLMAATFATSLILYRVVSIVTGIPLLGTIAMFLVIGFAALWPFTQPNQYLEIEAISEGLEKIGSNRGKHVSLLMEWSMRGAAQAYPVGYYSRQTVARPLFGSDF